MTEIKYFWEAFEEIKLTPYRVEKLEYLLKTMPHDGHKNEQKRIEEYCKLSRNIEEKLANVRGYFEKKIAKTEVLA